MILTFKKTDLLKKLRAAKAKEIADIEKANAELAPAFEKFRTAQLEVAQRFITEMSKVKFDLKKDIHIKEPEGDYYMGGSGRYADKYKKPESTQFDGAIALLESCAEDTIEINTAHDKLGLASAVKMAVGG